MEGLIHNECPRACVSIGLAQYAIVPSVRHVRNGRAGTWTWCVQIEQIDQRFSSHAL